METKEMSNRNKKEEVQTAIKETRTELSPYLRQLDVRELSRHNTGYLDYVDTPVASFIDAETHTHSRIIGFLHRSLPKGAKILDIGFFIPVVPIALAKLGFKVSSIENLEFYGRALDSIISFASQSHGIEVYDLDILHDSINVMGQFDAVILSAILEHLNGTPRHLLERARHLGKREAYYVVTVPNVAALRKRLIFLLRGTPPFPPISVYYHSDYPFTGHNREYTVRDLGYVLNQSGFDILQLESYNRPSKFKRSLTSRLLNIITRIGSSSLRESIMAIAQQSNSGT
jgi:2-polyprenyl-3-methyl-5-hydroxy-6-metoxy-1,4-benzoquinol methylase